MQVSHNNMRGLVAKSLKKYNGIIDAEQDTSGQRFKRKNWSDILQNKKKASERNSDSLIGSATKQSRVESKLRG